MVKFSTSPFRVPLLEKNRGEHEGENTMKTFHVTVPVITAEIYEIYAETEEEAKELVGLGQGEPLGNIEYTADEDSNNWTVEEVEL